MPKRKDSAQALILVTGAAGFIGAFLCRCLLEEGDACVVGFDNVNDYYDVGIKEGRLRMLAEAAGGSPEDADVDGFSCGRFEFVRGDLADEAAAEALFERACPDVVVNLAAQAGVRYSIENPRAYVDSNLVGFFNVLEACRRHPVGHLVYASSSSVYGGNEKVPFSEEDRVDSPVSLYAATKKSNELMAHAYSKLYSIPATGLRFFTVYGPMGRPDMAYFGFTEKLVRGESIKIFNMGDCMRDFTYVEDVVEAVARVMGNPPEVGTGPDGLPLAAHRVYNVGNSSPESLLDFVDTLQRVLVEEGILPEDYDFEAHRELVPMQPGDVPVTLRRHLGARARLRLQALDAPGGRAAGVRPLVQGVLREAGQVVSSAFLEDRRRYGDGGGGADLPRASLSLGSPQAAGRRGRLAEARPQAHVAEIRAGDPRRSDHRRRAVPRPCLQHHRQPGGGHRQELQLAQGRDHRPGEPRQEERGAAHRGSGMDRRKQHGGRERQHRDGRADRS